MDNWAILNLEPTDDPEGVKQAYMTLLPKHNPEDDIEGFLRLRMAYEEILKEIGSNDKAPDTPHSLFIKDVEEVYKNFPLRCDIDSWKALLEQEVCQRLDMVDQAECLLIQFLLNNFFLSRDVWALLVRHFDWETRAEALKQDYPPQFMDYVLKKMTEDEYPKFGLFSPMEDNLPYDQWISLFLEIDALINANQMESPALGEKQVQLEALPLSHPYYNILMAKLESSKGEFEKALAIMEPVYQEYPQDIKIQIAHTAILPHLDRGEEALARFEEMLEETPAFVDAKRGILGVYIQMKNYESAETSIKDILETNPYDLFALSAEQPVAAELAILYEEKVQANPSDTKTLLSLAENLIKSQQKEKCLEVLAQLPDEEPEPKALELKAMCAIMEGDWETALSFYESLIKVEPKLSYYGNAATSLNNLGQHNEAIDYVATAIEKFCESATLHDKTKLYAIQCQAATAAGRFDMAIKALDAGLEINNRDPHLCAQKANLCWQTGRYSEAMDLSDLALSIFPYMTDPYVVQMEIYHRETMYEMVLAIAARAEAIGYNSPKIGCHKAEALRMLGQYDQALEIMEELVVAEFDEGYIDAIYTEMAQLKDEIGDLEDAISYICKALLLGGEDNPPRQSIQANILRKQGLLGAAKSICNEIIDKAPGYIPARVELGHILVDEGDLVGGIELFESAISVAENYEPFYDRIIDLFMNSEHSEEALDWTQRRLNRFESLPNRIYVAIMHVRLGQFELAEEAYKKAIEIYPDAPDGPRYYGLFLQNNRRYKEAVEQFEKSTQLAPGQLDLLESIAFCYQEEKEYNKALAALDLAEETENPYNEGALAMRRGVIYEDMLRHEESLAQMLRAASLPDKLDGEWQMSWIYTRIGLKYSKNFNDAAKAMEYLNMAIEEDEDCIDAVDYMGDIYMYAHKDYEKAIECYAQKIKSDPTDPHAYVTRGLAYTKTKQDAKAKKDFKKAIALFEEKSQEDPSPCWQVYIANCRLGLKEIDMARGLFEEGLATPEKPGAWCNKPQCDVCLYSLGQICELDGNFAEALEYYNQAICISNSIKHNVARDEILDKE
ncbi:MAG: tetratricopeptide repeat protein [Defluviitaleaceae bacterium]|nr:tetratricopeptide repeat protein [Defluviitaleaceae bacterium]